MELEVWREVRVWEKERTEEIAEVKSPCVFGVGWGERYVSKARHSAYIMELCVEPEVIR